MRVQRLPASSRQRIHLWQLNGMLSCKKAELEL
jgi:hypothetical protein